MNIGQLARHCGVPIDTIRYYERQGLLPQARRSANGYRQYDANDTRRLRFVRRAKELGFSLEEVAGLLALSGAGEADMAQVRAAAQEKMEMLQGRIDELIRVRQALGELVRACPGHGDLEHCPIMTALGADTP